VDLIDKLGRGYSKEQLIKLGAVTPWSEPQSIIAEFLLTFAAKYDI
jgi:hypothetical protein